MKNPLSPFGGILSTGCLLAMLTGSIRAEEPVMEFVNPDDPALAEVRKAGERAVDQVGVAFLSEVRRVLKETTPALAIAKLHLKEYRLPVPLPGQLAVTAVRRTSFKVRSEANAPDAADVAALQKIQRLIEGGDTVPKLLVQKLARSDQPPEWRIYRPLATPSQCLVCHGTPEELAPGVPDTLHTFFPNDKAVGFTAGSWRGVIRVSLTEPPARK